MLEYDIKIEPHCYNIFTITPVGPQTFMKCYDSLSWSAVLCLHFEQLERVTGYQSWP